MFGKNNKENNDEEVKVAKEKMERVQKAVSAEYNTAIIFTPEGSVIYGNPAEIVNTYLTQDKEIQKTIKRLIKDAGPADTLRMMAAIMSLKEDHEDCNHG